MPYNNINELPNSIKNNLPKEAQQIFMAAFNNAIKEKDEEASMKIAWSAVKNVYEQDKDGKWIRTEKNYLQTNNISPEVLNKMLLRIKDILPEEAYNIWMKAYGLNLVFGSSKAMEMAWDTIYEDYEEDYKTGIWYKKEKNSLNPVLLKHKDDTYSIKNKPIGRIGDFSKGLNKPYEKSHFEQIIKNYIDNTIPIKANTFDHVESEVSGLPAVGWIENPRIEENTLIIDVKDIPKQAGEWLAKGYYKNTSSEIRWIGDNPHLVRVAFLGATIPNFTGLPTFDKAIESNAFDGIKDILEYNEIAIKTQEKREVKNMEKPKETKEEITGEKLELNHYKEENEKLSKELFDMTNNKIDIEKKFNEKVHELDKIVKEFNAFKAETRRKEFNAFCDDLKITDEETRKDIIEDLVNVSSYEKNDGIDYVAKKKELYKKLTKTMPKPPEGIIEKNAKEEDSILEKTLKAKGLLS